MVRGQRHALRSSGFDPLDRRSCLESGPFSSTSIHQGLASPAALCDWDDVERRAALLERQSHAVEGGGTAKLRIEGIVVRHVVAVRAARATLEAGREIRVADPKRVEVWGERCHLIESERCPELDAIRRVSPPPEGGDHLREYFRDVGHEWSSGLQVVCPQRGRQQMWTFKHLQ